MHIVITAIGRMKSGNEREMLEKYVKRVIQTGKMIGVSGIDIIEPNESRAKSSELRKEEEARKLLAAISTQSSVVALDESGDSLNSKDLANFVDAQINNGKEKLTFVIGGADGLGSAVFKRANKTIAFGSMTWPHMLARIMLTEQIYRAITILSGHPYHRN